MSFGVNTTSFEKLNALVVDFFVMLSDGNVLVSGLTAGDFTIRLYNPSGSEVSGSIPVTIAEYGTSGNYKASFTPNAEGEWVIEIVHATYAPSGKRGTYLVYTVLLGQSDDASVVQYFVVLDSDSNPVTGEVQGDFTIALYNPSGTEVSSSVPVTITELGSGLYKATYSAASAEGKWLLEIKHATYFSYGKRAVYRYETSTVPTAPSITAVSVSGTTVTVTVDGDATATNYARIFDDSDDLIDTQSRSGDGTIDLTVVDRGAFYDVIAYSYHADGNYSAPSAPYRIYVPAASDSKLANLRAAIMDRLEGSTTLQTILGTDAQGNYPIYEAHNAGAPDTQHVVTYTFTSKLDSTLSHRTRRIGTIEIIAECKDTTAAAEDTLDRIEQVIDELFRDWGHDGSVYVVQRSWRDGESIPTFDAAGQGYTGRSWLYSIEFDEK